MGRLIIDCTQLINWQGRLTGVPRVMDELCSRYSKEDCIFVGWNPVECVFTEYSYADIGIKRSQPRHKMESDNTAPRLRASRLARKIATRVPYARTLKAEAARRLDSIKRESSSAQVQPTNGDTLLILWGTWDDDRYIESVVAARASGAHLVQMVYDMLPLVTPQFSGHSTVPLHNFASKVYPKCDLLLAISEHTKRDTETWLQQEGLTVPRIEVFRLGEDFSFSKVKKPEDARFGGVEKGGYLLAVGTIEARKNHALLYYTYKLAKQRGVSLPKLVVVGRRGWLTDDIYTLITTDPETKSQFIILDGVSDEELSWLYGHCLFSIYPSFYEGWGLPIAESVARGVPCIASRTSSMPEIAGDLITYFSPASTDECLDAIRSLLEPKNLAAAAKRVESYRPTSWDQTFDAVNKSIKEIR